jgi:hypothetical protein
MAQIFFESDPGMSEEVFTPQPEQDPFGTWNAETAPEKKSNGCLKGCLIAAAIVLALAVLGGWLASQYWRSWASGFARTTINQTLKQSGLPEFEQKEIQVQVERLLAEFQEGRLTQAQAERLMDQLADSPLSASVIAFTIEKQYFDHSGLRDEEKESGRMTLRRCVRGVFNGDLSEEDGDAVLGTIGTKQPDGNWELNETLTDEELRTFLEKAKSRADAAGVPEIVEEVDPSDEIKRIIDAVLNPEASETNDTSLTP